MERMGGGKPFRALSKMGKTIFRDYKINISKSKMTFVSLDDRISFLIEYK